MRHLHRVRGEQFQKRIVCRLLLREGQQARIELGDAEFRHVSQRCAGSGSRSEARSPNPAAKARLRTSNTRAIRRLLSEKAYAFV